ncbi:MAG TPA: sulfur carrier protein ThiS [Bacteroidales bacterium]|nr:sulfur carrier protein ThiS [Bacteroidales bacterium]HPE58096.1 sulfur carrier protein ThiS [Bacteroidales bacterium]HRX96447.1 sulfur carrier protein ThiS [Bacteroidales bacterium]
MQITLNNRPEIIDKKEITISELINLKSFTFKLLVTKINGNLIKKADRETAVIKDGDKVDIIHLISGG